MRRVGRRALLLLVLTIGPLSAEAPPNLPELPRTDGAGLPPPPPAIGTLEWPRLIVESRRACEGPCTTPFGQVLGVADGAEARSNCVSTCVQPERSFLDLESGEIAVSRDALPDSTKRYLISKELQPRAGSTAPGAARITAATSSRVCSVCRSKRRLNT